MLHQLLDQHLGQGDRERDEFGLLAKQLFEGDAKGRRRLLGSLFTFCQLGDGGFRVGKETEALATLAVVDAMQFCHQPLHRLVGRQSLTAGIGVRLTVIAGAQGVKNDLVDIETHVTKP
ncbi:hypothetical protein D3C85_830390 [compost metagenome]